MDATGSALTFGQWLRRRRRSLDLTQAELATRLHCAKGTIRRFEADDLRPSKLLAEQMAEALGVPTQLRANFVLFARQGLQADVAFDSFSADGPEREKSVTSGAPPPHAPRRYVLPVSANPLLGRDHAVSVALELLARPDVRLITLIGPPGVGKTRLALQIAEQVQPRLREGACFVPLAPLYDAERVLPAIAQAIDLRDSGRILATALADRLRSEEMVLVLDNFEHVIDAAPEIAALLAAVPTLKVLCTSRVALRIWGEHEFVVPPLALPDLTQLSAQEALAANPAVALFVARARAAYPGFALSNENVRQIAEICHRLDGLPLAIELAATRIKLFSPAAILARLEQRLPFLTGGARDAPARHRTLTAAIAWSYDLLTATEQLCLARLGVFWGGWTLESAETVCGDDVDVINALTVLVDHSLVQSVHTEQGDVRFVMLETIREFALNRLSERAETDGVQIRHARYYLALAVAAERGLQGPDQVVWMARLNADQNNLRAAFGWSLTDGGDVELGLQAGAALWWFWWTNGQVGEGRRWLQYLLQRAADIGLTVTIPYGRALLGAGILAFFAGDFEMALSHFTAARDQGEGLGDTITQGYAIFMIGTVRVLSSQFTEGYALLDRGSLLLRNAGAAATWHVGVTSLARTLLSFEGNDLDAAQQHADAGMAIFSELGQPYGIGLAFNYQGDVARLRGDHAAASKCYATALPLLRQANAKSEIPAVLHNLAHVMLAQDEAARARELFAEGFVLHHEIGNQMGMVECLIGLAAVALTQDQPQAAATFLGATDAMLATLNIPLFAAEQTVYLHTQQAVRQVLGEAHWRTAYDAGRVLTSAEIVTVLGASPHYK
jgi:predicted ATPase/transcriptional regulator with XRE-family HTH domain